MIAMKTVLTAVKTAEVRSPVQTADTTAHWRVVSVHQPGGRIYDKNIPMYDHQRVARCVDNGGQRSALKTADTTARGELYSFFYLGANT